MASGLTRSRRTIEPIPTALCIYRFAATECDPNLADADIAMVGRNIGEAMTKQISAARELYKQTGKHLWVADGKVWDDDDGETIQ